MSKTISYSRWDEDRQGWRYFVATYNPETGVYDQDITETDEIGIELEGQ